VESCRGHAFTLSTLPRRCTRSSCCKPERAKPSGLRSSSSSSDHTEVSLHKIIKSPHILILTPHRSRLGRISAPLMRCEHDLLLELRNDEEAHQRSRRRPRRLKRHALTKKVEHSILDFEQGQRPKTKHTPKHFTPPRQQPQGSQSASHEGEIIGNGQQSKTKQRNHHWKECHETGSTVQSVAKKHMRNITGHHAFSTASARTHTVLSQLNETNA
jgi:hypothetical protein